jgi:iron complex transport system substrate-binding protein
MLQVAGATNVLGDIQKQAVDMSSELILARAPDVIVELRYGDSIRVEPSTSDRLVWNALASVPAVKTNRVYVLGGDEFVIPGPRIARAAERMARVLHPEVW